ncbi:COP9 signalosome complex subunit 5 [Spathaspora sp. JA1]|nr:COP9 signalosome complex subunit 5 [Spathaspora sp. JA1]
MPCFHDLATALELKNYLKGTKVVDLYDLPTGKVKSSSKHTPTTTATSDKFYQLPPMSPKLASSRPWKSDPHYFTTCHISSLAILKMSIHAQSGGNIEVMGMLIGKIIPGAIIIMDVYALPVEGTETRVNAQAEGYEYMVEYLELNKKVSGRNENIVGWYHSHPGYGCWLSGIDVSTQSLNQGFQDPYLAIVVDPIKTIKQGKVEIGAFRTFPENYVASHSDHSSSKPAVNIPKSKRKDFGSHFDKYYPLDIEIFSSGVDDSIIQMLKFEDSITWLKSLLKEGPAGDDGDIVKVVKKSKYIKSMDLIDNYDVISNDSSSNKSFLFTFMDELKNHKVSSDFSIPRKFESNFEDVIYTKLLTQGSKKPGEDIKNSRNRRTRVVDMSEDEVMDESDLDNDSRGISDVDDVASMGSGSANAGDESIGIEQLQEEMEDKNLQEKEDQREDEHEEQEEDEVIEGLQEELEEELEVHEEEQEEIEEATSVFNKFSGMKRLIGEAEEEALAFGSVTIPGRRPPIQKWNTSKGLSRESKLSKFGLGSDNSGKGGSTSRPFINRGESAPNNLTLTGGGGSGHGSSFGANSGFFISSSDTNHNNSGGFSGFGSNGNPNSRFLVDDSKGLRKMRNSQGVRSSMAEGMNQFMPNPYPGIVTPTTRGIGDDTRARTSQLQELAQLATGIGQAEVYDLITMEVQERLFS